MRQRNQVLPGSLGTRRPRPSMLRRLMKVPEIVAYIDSLERQSGDPHGYDKDVQRFCEKSVK